MNQTEPGTPAMPTNAPTDIQENLVRQIGEVIFEKSQQQDGKSYFSKDFWYGRIMEWSMANEQFKIQMFRFVDVLPYLHSGSEVARHLKEYFAEGGDKLPSIFNLGVGVGSLAPSLMAGAIRKNVTEMAKLFITGENPKDALSVIKKSRKQSIGFTADILGEAALSEKESLEYQRRYLELIDWLARDAKSWDEQKLIDRDHLGPIPKVNVSVKLTSLYSQIKLAAWESSIEVLKERLRPILRKAIENGVFINLDMEQYEVKDLTLEVFRQLLLEDEFKRYPHFGIVVQAYLRDSLADLRSLVAFSKTRGTPFTIRLVKGAYWDFETIRAQQQGWPYPVYTNKKESDANYEDCTKEIFSNYQFLRLAIGSHNVRSIAAAIATAEKLGIAREAFEIQMLFGMADTFKKALVEMGYRVREYAPIGDLIPGMAYLVRRLLENTSNESFLKSKFSDGVSSAELLKDPKFNLRTSSENSLPQRKFLNEPLIDFSKSANRQKMGAALIDVRKQFTRIYSLNIQGKELRSERQLASYNPSQKNEVVGSVCVAGVKEAELAIAYAKSKSLSWANTAPTERAKLFENLAQIMLKKRFELMALMVFEAGKSWSEADGDVTEAIDFCRYYAWQMCELSEPKKMGWIPGETNHYLYKPRGIVAVIAPWNFPLAILTGMVAAAAVTGNTVIMKPAEQTSVIGAWLMEMLNEAGVPAGVVQFLPGFGEEIGEHLVNHKDVDMIAFTGSRAVGLHIIEKAGHTGVGQRQVKKCVIEMGGKNAIIVDSDADLDEAIHGVINSAFGFQGQKCSACSRVIVLEENYDRFISRLIETASSLKTLPSHDPSGFMGPVIDQEAFAKITGMIENAKREARLVFQGQVPDHGYFIPPTIFADVDPTSAIAQQEIFGPVLAVIKAKNIEEALIIANRTEYGLTGGLYSRSPANIDVVKQGFEVGNLYINRSITGAMVERHPFGGFKMSGVGSKTGGPDYLLQFMEPRCISENTMRRGFAPEQK